MLLMKNNFSPRLLLCIFARREQRCLYICMRACAKRRRSVKGCRFLIGMNRPRGFRLRRARERAAVVAAALWF